MKGTRKGNKERRSSSEDRKGEGGGSDQNEDKDKEDRERWQKADFQIFDWLGRREERELHGAKLGMPSV